MSQKAPRGIHAADRKSNTGRHAAVAEPVSKKRILSKKVCAYLALSMAAVFIMMISAVLILNSAEQKSYEERMSSARDSFQRQEYEDALHELRAAAEIDSGEDCLMMMADCYDRLGNYDKALETLRMMDTSKASVSRKIAAIEQKRALLSQVEKVSIAGREYPVTSTALALDGLGITDANIPEILQLYALQNLSLADNKISDIQQLSSLGGLSTLNLSSNGISDISAITALTSLRTLYLDNNPISDLTPLYSLTGLANLSIKGIEITENELAALSAALPGCAIHSETAIEDVLDITMGGLTFKSDVTDLDLSGQKLTDISALTACTELRKLNLSSNQLTDLSPLMNLPNIEWLNISNNLISDLRPIMGLASLRYVDASYNYIGDTAAVGAMTGLKELYLSYNEIKDFSGLRNLENLKTLGVKGTGLNDDALGYMSYLRNLTRLEIDDNFAISGEAVDGMMKTLEGCVLSHSTLIYSMDVDGHLVRTDTVELDLSAQGITDISGLGNVGSLQKLNLSQDSISNLYIFEHTNSRFSLKELYLGNNAIVDITPVACAFNLEILDLSGNMINSVQPLMGMQSLQQLYIQGNPLTEEQINELQTALPNCNIIWQ